MTNTMMMLGSKTFSSERTATALLGRWRSEVVDDDDGGKRSSDGLDSAGLFLKRSPARTVYR